ncbi:MAG: SDR family NAD(P)-dependent oxidoreductase [Calditrichae bacterium]|nr:SDR family NAD(P)-dependent oxidoreductase [Calditrichota bacterium]MCB9059154.1 SDR family NAD(P)-dependent oxidoreductase [Calditrichia bacterium]
MKSLDKKTVFITGASSGIGEACAHAFAREGSMLILAARRGDKLKDLQKELADLYDAEVEIIVLDVTDKDSVFEKLADIGPVDVLINNAGLALGSEKLHEMETTYYDQMIDTNIKGLLYVTKVLVPKMADMGTGDIINIGSIAGHEVYAGGAVYCATKYAVDALTQGLRIDLVDTALRVSSIDPGAVQTEFSKVRFNGDQKKADKVYEGFSPLQGEDIAEIAVFIASRPAHVQIADVIVLATAQAGAKLISRKN